MTFEVTAYTVKTNVEHGGFKLEVTYETGLIVPARNKPLSGISIIIDRPAGVKGYHPRIETPVTEDSLQPILETLVKEMGETEAQILFENLIGELGELDAEVLRIDPKIFSDDED